MTTRAEVVAFVSQSAALHRFRPAVFRPRADRGDALVDSLRTGVAHALASRLPLSVECAECGGEGLVEVQRPALSLAAGGHGAPDYEVVTCSECYGDGTVEAESCVHGARCDPDYPHDDCVETWHYFLGPVGEGDGCREIACDPFAAVRP